MSSQLIPSDAVKAIQDSVETTTLAVPDDVYSTRHVFLPPEDPEVSAIELTTLEGLVRYVKSDFDKHTNEIAIHVASHRKVKVISRVFGRHRQRETFAKAEPDTILGTTFRFGEFYPIEAFVIFLQALFIPTDEREAVLKVVGNIKEEAVKQTSDDGVTQSVTAKSGIVRVEEVQVPNPVELQPYRTFREIEQPVSPFILRLHDGPKAALFEADGGKWKLMAIQRIERYLRDELKEEEGSEILIIT